MSEVILHETRDFHLDQFSSLSHLKKENEESKKSNFVYPSKSKFFHPCAVELHLPMLPWPEKKSFECGE